MTTQGESLRLADRHLNGCPVRYGAGTPVFQSGGEECGRRVSPHRATAARHSLKPF
jgi:hypothetical protein